MGSSGLFAAQDVSGCVAEGVGLKLNENIQYLICSEVFLSSAGIAERKKKKPNLKMYFRGAERDKYPDQKPPVRGR